MKTLLAIMTLALTLTLSAGISEAATNGPQKANNHKTASVAKPASNKNNKSKKAHTHHHAKKQKKTGNK